MSSPAVLKLGFSSKQDASTLRQSFPGTHVDIAPALDLQQVAMHKHR